MIDDCEDDTFLLGMALNKHGLKALCTRVDTAPAMRNALDAGAWDIVISDHRMPGFDSGAALQILKDSGRDIRAIASLSHKHEHFGAKRIRG